MKLRRGDRERLEILGQLAHAADRARLRRRRELQRRHVEGIHDERVAVGRTRHRAARAQVLPRRAGAEIGVLRIGERAELLSALERLRELDRLERLRHGSDGMRNVPENRVEGPIRKRSFEDRQILQRDRVALGVLRRLLPNELGRGPRRKRLLLARVLIGQRISSRPATSSSSIASTSRSPMAARSCGLRLWN